MTPFLPVALIVVAALAGCAHPPAPDATTAEAAPPRPTILAQPLGGGPATAPPVVIGEPQPAGPLIANESQPAPVTGPVNGFYQGRMRQVETKIPACPLPALGVIEIGDRTLLYPYTFELIYVAPIQADGTIHAAVGNTTLDGTLIDGRLAFNVTTPECQASFDFHRERGF